MELTEDFFRSSRFVDNGQLLFVGWGNASVGLAALCPVARDEGSQTDLAVGYGHADYFISI
jgi:hypothetical protein